MRFKKQNTPYFLLFPVFNNYPCSCNKNLLKTKYTVLNKYVFNHKNTPDFKIGGKESRKSFSYFSV